MPDYTDLIATLNATSATNADSSKKDGLCFLNDPTANDSILLRSKYKKDIALYEALDKAYHDEIAKCEADPDRTFQPIKVKRTLTVRFLDDRYQGEVAEIEEVEIV